MRKSTRYKVRTPGGLRRIRTAPPLWQHASLRKESARITAWESAHEGYWAKGNPVKKSAVALIVSVLILCLLTAVGCGNGPWVNAGGGVSSYGIQSLAYDSTHKLLYAGCDSSGAGAGVWKYDGTSWTKTGGGFSGYVIDSLAYDSVGNMLYAGMYGQGVWRYDGMSWTNTGGAVSSYDTGPLAYDSTHKLLYAVCFNPATNTGGVWKYNGTTWTNTGGAVPIIGDSLVYDSVGNMLYAGMYGQGVWKYNGTSWTNTGEDFSSYYINSLAYDSTNNMLYAGTGGAGVWGYNVNTSIWEDISIGCNISGYYIDSLAYDSTHNAALRGDGQQRGLGVQRHQPRLDRHQ